MPLQKKHVEVGLNLLQRKAISTQTEDEETSCHTASQTNDSDILTASMFCSITDELSKIKKLLIAQLPQSVIVESSSHTDYSLNEEIHHEQAQQK